MAAIAKQIVVHSPNLDREGKSLRNSTSSKLYWVKEIYNKKKSNAVKKTAQAEIKSK